LPLNPEKNPQQNINKLESVQAIEQIYTEYDNILQDQNIVKEEE
jgi:hypothetical protein